MKTIITPTIITTAKQGQQAAGATGMASLNECAVHDPALQPEHWDTTQARLMTWTADFTSVTSDRRCCQSVDRRCYQSVDRACMTVRALTCLGHDVAHLGVVQQPPHLLLARQCCIAHHTPFIMVAYSIFRAGSGLEGSRCFRVCYRMSQIQHTKSCWNA